MMQLLEQNRIVLSNLNKVICVCSILLKGWSGRDRKTISAGWSKRPTHNPPFCPTVFTKLSHSLRSLAQPSGNHLVAPQIQKEVRQQLRQMKTWQ